MWAADDFLTQLAGFDLDVFEASSNTVYALRPDFSLAYYNGAWARFALENHGDPAKLRNGDCPDAIEACTPSLRHFYRGLFQRVLDTGEPLEHEYLCPSPTLERRFVMRIRPLPGGLLVTNHLLVETPHGEPGKPAREPVYTAENGIITQCAHCRMTRRADDPNTWDWVPGFVAVQPDNLSHGLCPTCFQYHYPKLAKRYYRARRRRG